MDNNSNAVEHQLTVVDGSNTDLTVTNLKDIPFVGQIFPNLEACHSFCCLYASRVGFDVRQSSQKMYLNKANDLREVGLKFYVCNKKGIWLEKLESES